MKQMMVIAPIDLDEDKTQHVAEEDREKRAQRSPARVLGRFEFQHHDGDDDGQHAVAECFEPAFTHSALFYLPENFPILDICCGAKTSGESRIFDAITCVQ